MGTKGAIEMAVEMLTREPDCEAALAGGVNALAASLGLRDGETGRHSWDVGELACAVGRRLGLTQAALLDLDYASRLHDVGKLGVPDGTLMKPGSLAPEEWELIEKHPVWGADLVALMPGLERVALIVRHHHERFDGSGYPDGLAGGDIPVESRILAVCDAWEAMISERPYRRALEPAEAVKELARGSGGQFDPETVAALLAEVGAVAGPTAGSPRAETNGWCPPPAAAHSRPGP